MNVSMGSLLMALFAPVLRMVFADLVCARLPIRVFPLHATVLLIAMERVSVIRRAVSACMMPCCLLAHLATSRLLLVVMVCVRRVFAWRTCALAVTSVLSLLCATRALASATRLPATVHFHQHCMVLLVTRP